MNVAITHRQLVVLGYVVALLLTVSDDILFHIAGGLVILAAAVGDYYISKNQ